MVVLFGCPEFPSKSQQVSHNQTVLMTSHDFGDVPHYERRFQFRLSIHAYFSSCRAPLIRFIVSSKHISPFLFIFSGPRLCLTTTKSTSTATRASRWATTTSQTQPRNRCEWDNLKDHPSLLLRGRWSRI